MDEDFRVLTSELERRFMTGDNADKTCDIADWISYFAWDLLGNMTWSKRMGFMEHGEDVGGMVNTAENVMSYFSVVRFASALYRSRLTCTGWPDPCARQASWKEPAPGEVLQV